MGKNVNSALFFVLNSKKNVMMNNTNWGGEGGREYNTGAPGEL